MRKVFALLFLSALVLPYARAPLCQLGSHEHEEEAHIAMSAMESDAHEQGHAHPQHGHAHAEPGDDADHPGLAHVPASSIAPIGDADCHDLMRCQVGASVVAIGSEGDSTIRIDLGTDETPLVASLLGQQPAPELPPPRLI